MFSPFLPLVIYIILVCVFGCALAWRSLIAMKTMSKWRILGACSLPLLACIVFWTLVLHMHTHFNGWPENIQDHLFSVALERHREIQEYILTLTFGVAFIVAPLSALLVWARPRLRPLLNYLGIFYLAFLLLALSIFTDIAPKGYRDWFWD